MPYQRLACFKVKNEADIPKVIETYQTLAKEQSKDGKPYILKVAARKTVPNERDLGYNFVAQTFFQTWEDLEFYDKDCPAHKKLKATLPPWVEGPPLSLFMEYEDTAT